MLIPRDSSASDDVTYDVDSVHFYDKSSAGSASIYTIYFNFTDQSTAGDATIVALPYAYSHNLFDYGLDGKGTPTVGNAHITLLGGDEEHSPDGAYLTIYPQTILGNGTFTVEPATVAGGFGATLVILGDDLTGGTFTANGSAVSGGDLGSAGGTIMVASPGVASDGTYIINGATAAGGESGEMTVAGASAGAAFITLNGGENGGVGGKLTISQTGTGGNARVAAFGNGLININLRVDSATIGSIEGDGVVALGKTNLMIGSNNLSTTFSGTIQETGSISKIGTGTLTLTGSNTYTGGTTLASGILLVSNTTGSGTGAGAVGVNAGTLGGSGVIFGGVIVGTGNGPGANLAPALGARGQQATLTFQSSLTVQADATYTYTFKARSSEARSDLVIAKGVTINGATIKLKGKTQGTVTPGTVLTVISNTSANPISGTFSNLADGAIVNIGGVNFQADYEGGDGNDLTLTVVPCK